MPAHSLSHMLTIYHGIPSLYARRAEIDACAQRNKNLDRGPEVGPDRV